MKSRIDGITVTLYDRKQIGTDELNRPVYADVAEEVEDVLPGLPTTEEVTNALTLTGKHAQYTLHIPKGDAHEWENRKVAFYGQTFRTFGFVTQTVDSNTPTRWNRKIMVERNE